MKKQIIAPPEDWPLTARQCKRAESKTLFEALAPIQSVQKWINRTGADNDERDRLACSLVSNVGDFRANAQQQKFSKAEHRKYFQDLALQLSHCATTLRAGPPARIWASFITQVEVKVAAARVLAKHPNMAGRTQGQNADRNEFARELSLWIAQSNSGKFKHSMVADVTNAIFPDAAGRFGSEQVRDLVRKTKNGNFHRQ